MKTKINLSKAMKIELLACMESGVLDMDACPVLDKAIEEKSTRILKGLTKEQVAQILADEPIEH